MLYTYGRHVCHKECWAHILKPRAVKSCLGDRVPKLMHVNNNAKTKMQRSSGFQFRGS